MIVGISIDCKWSTFGNLRSKCFRAVLKQRTRNESQRQRKKMARVKELSFQFSRSQNRKSRSYVFHCSETNRKRLLRRLQFWKHRFFLKSKMLIKWFEFFIWSWIFSLEKKLLYYINTNEIPGELSRENMISSHVKITCYFHMWKYHRCYGYIITRAFRRIKLFQRNGFVFHWCLYNK